MTLVQRVYVSDLVAPRHRNSTRLTPEPVSERHFSTWSMGSKRLRAGDLQKVPKYAPFFRYGFGAQAFDAAPGDALGMPKRLSQNMF